MSCACPPPALIFPGLVEAKISIGKALEITAKNAQLSLHPRTFRHEANHTKPRNKRSRAGQAEAEVVFSNPDLLN
jgi:hypothetical protein